MKKLLTIPEYNEKLKSLRSDDDPLDRYLDEESKEAEELEKANKTPRKRIAQALLEAASALERQELAPALADLVKLAQQAQAQAKRGKFSEAQGLVEDASSLIEGMLAADLFREADESRQFEDEAAADYPKWARES